MAILAAIFLAIFFSIFGCPFEFIKCYYDKYISKKSNLEDVSLDSIDEEYIQNQYNSVINTSNPNVHFQEHTNENNNLIEEIIMYDDIFYMILIGILGLAIQPLYLTFYIMYGIMECFRRFNCWFYYM